MGKGDRARFKRIVKGRKRKSGTRTPSGQFSRSALAQPKEDPTVVMIDARMRHHHVTEEQAKSPLAGTEQGRLFMRGVIGSSGLQAAERYASLRAEWYRLCGAPREARPISLEGDPIRSTAQAVQTSEEREERVRMSWERIQAAFAWKTALLTTLNDVVVRNERIHVSRYPQLISALTIIARLEGLQEDSICGTTSADNRG